jgi:hypothetical protein
LRFDHVEGGRGSCECMFRVLLNPVCIVVEVGWEGVVKSLTELEKRGRQGVLASKMNIGMIAIMMRWTGASSYICCQFSRRAKIF